MDLKRLLKNKKFLLIAAVIAIALIIFLAVSGRLSDLFAPAGGGSETVAGTTEAAAPGETAAPATDPQQTTPAPDETQAPSPETAPLPAETGTEPTQTVTQPPETETEPAGTQTQPVETETEPPETEPPETQPAETTPEPLDVNGTYTSKEDVALYLHTYGKLPKNYVTKSQAQAKGWSGGSLEKYFPGCAIGGDYFGNAEKHLPTNTKYHECDIDTLVPDGKGGWKSVARGAKRIVYSDDGHIYYTEDHYETFTQLY